MRTAVGLSLAVIPSVLVFAVETHAAEPTDRGELRRSIDQYLFLDAELGARYRRAVYAENAAPGPDDRSEVRVTVNGAAGGAEGPLGAYVGLTAIARLPTRDTFEDFDPFADPFDKNRFDLSRNLRLFGASVEYLVRDEERRERIAVRAGRLSDLDRAGLVLFDGLSARLRFGDAAVRVFGGRRAFLDRGFANLRTDAGVQAVGGADLSLTSGALEGSIGYRFEDAHRALIDLAYFFGEEMELSLGAEVILGPTSPALAGGSMIEDASNETAILLRTDGVWRASSYETSLSWQLEALLGEDPRPFGRNGLLRSEDVRAVIGLPIDRARIDRLFFGGSGPNVRAQIDVEQWLGRSLSLAGGSYLYLPLGDAKNNLEPQVLELWIGPAIGFGGGSRAGAEVRYVFEDPGTPNRIFSLQGDGLRRYGVVRAFGEIGLPLNEELRLAVRPEVEASSRDTLGPLQETSNLYGFGGGLMIALASSGGFRAAARYGLERIPSFDSEGVDLVHALEGWVGGSF